MEVPKLGVKPELQPLAYATATPKLNGASSSTNTIAHGNAGPLTH